MEQHLGNATSTTLLHQLRDLWKSPRGTIIRIEALTLVAIALSFFLAAVGSCRRRSNWWLVQKGVLAANVLSLSFGTYSIGLMQSSPVKSEMYPIWAVSILTLLGCVDSITAYSLDNKGQLWKMLYQLCVFCGYVLLISITNVSSDVGNIAVSVLSAITFIKGFHRSLALILPGRLRDMIRVIANHMEKEVLRRRREDFYYNPMNLTGYRYVVHWRYDEVITIDEIWQCNDEVHVFNKDVCLALSLSHLLQRRFFGLDCVESADQMTRNLVLQGLLTGRDGVPGYDRAFKLIEVELAFLYDVFFTSNAFLQYYESKAATIWALASIVGICFVGVAAAVIHGKRTTQQHTSVVGTITADFVVTLVILAALALLQLSQLIRCWTSNWARVALVCDYIRNGRQLTCWMRLRGRILAKIDCDNNHLWQNKLGQYSLVESVSTRDCKLLRALGGRLYQIYSFLSGIFGLQYMVQVLREMLGTKTGDAVVLHADVKAAIADFLTSSHGELVPFSFQRATWHLDLGGDDIVKFILRWHVATCYSELAVRKDGFRVEDENGADREIVKKNHGVATALSKYCAYLVVSEPQLLPGQHLHTKYVHDEVMRAARTFLRGAKNKLETMRRLELRVDVESSNIGTRIFLESVALGMQLESRPDRWKVMAEFWVQALLNAAPSDNVDDHMERLSQGGEFITHLWALLSHTGILKRAASA